MRPLKPGPGFAEVNGLDLWYTVEGTGPLCLVPSPGWGYGVDAYARTFSPLADALTLVHFETRGTGRSERPATTKDYRYRDFASDRDLAEGVAAALPLYFRDYAGYERHRAAVSGVSFSIHPYRGWYDSENARVRMLDRLPAIKCPTLLLVGEHDFVCPPMCSRAIHERLPGSELELFPESGHFPWLEEPERFFAAVRRFLSAKN